MERRFVVKSTVCREFEAFVIGNPEEIARLLEGIDHVGKFRTAGYGDIAEWRIEPMELTATDVLLRDGKFVRPVPIEVAADIGIATLTESISPSFAAWTPPYWHGASMGNAWRCGTRIEVEAQCV